MTDQTSYPAFRLAEASVEEIDTAAANRLAALETHRRSCANLGLEMDPELTAEWHTLRHRRVQIDPADDQLLIEVLSDPAPSAPTPTARLRRWRR